MFQNLKKQKSDLVKDTKKGHDFLICLSMVFYCIKSDVAFPYMIQESPFDWETFY